MEIESPISRAFGKSAAPRRLDTIRKTNNNQHRIFMKTQIALVEPILKDKFGFYLWKDPANPLRIPQR